jgi:hypothetical protein
MLSLTALSTTDDKRFSMLFEVQERKIMIAFTPQKIGGLGFYFQLVRTRFKPVISLSLSSPL